MSTVMPINQLKGKHIFPTFYTICLPFLANTNKNFESKNVEKTFMTLYCEDLRILATKL